MEKPTIEVLDNIWKGASYDIVLTCQDFTCLCPFSLKPDFATLQISYTPGDFLVESRSLKHYLAAFHNSPILQEFAVNTICHDLAAVLHPKTLSVTGTFATRAGISIIATAHNVK